MQTQFHSRRAGSSGYALLFTLIFITIILMAYASIMRYVATNAKITARNNTFNQSQAAAESATENVLATMMRDFEDQNLNSPSAYTGLIPSQTGWPVQFQFSSTNGVTNQVSVSIGTAGWAELPGAYSGLNGLGQDCRITATATPLNQLYNPAATVSQTVWFGSIPVFQYAIFYNMDMEINPGANMTVNGPVHANGNIYATGSSSQSPLTFSSHVEASQSVNLFPGPNDGQNIGRSGNVNFLITTNNPLSNANPLTLPIGTNNDPIAVRSLLGLPPSNLAAPNAAAYSALGQNYPYNEADLIISNSPSGTNLAVYYQNQNYYSALTPVPPDVTNVTVVHTGGQSVNVTNTYYSFATNVSFYDWREYSTVQAVQIDVGQLDAWLTNNTGGKPYDVLNTTSFTSKGHGINSIYVYNNVPQIVGSSSTTGQLPAVRLVNGQELPPDGLTVATPQPLYVEGDYNTTTNGSDFATALGSTTNNTVPAALMADAITVLASSWSDTWNSGNAINARPAKNTTINAATLEGIVPSFTDSSGIKHYSGGVENFLRLLQNWSGKTLTYNGSIVVLFPSQYATHYWPGTGSVYNPPNRQWGFDPTFTQQSRLPPMTPRVRAIVRETWDYAAR